MQPQIYLPSDGEDGIVRGYAANPPLRSGPTRPRRPKSPGRDLVEPTNTVRCYTLSRRAPSTARPPLHKPLLKLHTGWDYSSLRSSPLRGRHEAGRYPRFVTIAIG